MRKADAGTRGYGKAGQKETYNLGRDHSQGESVTHSAPVNIQLSGSLMWTAASLNTPFFFLFVVCSWKLGCQRE